MIKKMFNNKNQLFKLEDGKRQTLHEAYVPPSPIP